MTDASFETAELLIAESALRGHTVSRSMLKRWYDAGLLPRFRDRHRQRGVGKTRGSTTVHPAGTLPQLLRVLELRAEAGRFDPDRALWRLWWEEWNVEPFRIRALLTTRLEDHERAIEQFQASLESDADPLVAFQTIRLEAPLGRARKRVGTGSFPTVPALLTQIASGAFDGWYADPASTGDDAEDRRLLWKTVGLERPIAELGPERHAFETEVGESFARLAQAVAPMQLHTALDAEVTSDADLAKARGEARGLLQAARESLPIVAQVFGASTAGHDLLRLPPREADEISQTGFLVWLALRRQPPYRELAEMIAVLSPLAAVLQTAIDAGPQMLSGRANPSDDTRQAKFRRGGTHE